LFGVAHRGEILAPFGHDLSIGFGASACVSRVAEVAEIEAAKVVVQKEVVDLIIYNRTIAGTQQAPSWFMEFMDSSGVQSHWLVAVTLTSPIGREKRPANFRTFNRSNAPEIGRAGFCYQSDCTPPCTR
jgi:hypothetical protein